MTTVISISDFLTHFPDYKARLREGESFSLCEEGKPLAEVTPVGLAAKSQRVNTRPPPGKFRHLIGDLSSFRAADADLLADIDAALK
jgi:antitoxin (DNA-binding transcriptional repressor) of toxin-antitoxin stability system